MFKFLSLFLFLSLSMGSSLAADNKLDLAKIKLANPYKNIEIFANNVENARSMTRGDKGTIFVGTRKLDKVYAITPNAAGTKADKVQIIAEGLDMPNGVAFHEGDLYVAENSRILRFPNIENHLDNPPSPMVVSDNLPNERHHGWRYIAFGPDNKLYIAIGAPCNICLSEDPIFATITRMNADGSNKEIYTKGVRNSVGMSWHPKTKELWFTSNGRDWLGDNLPPDQLNNAPRAGMDFGFPYFHARGLADPEYGQLRSPSDVSYPTQPLGPHVAALGMVFLDNDTIIIAEHGSWNRSKRIGYRLTKVTLKNNKPVSYEPYITGWLQNEEFWGRPVDILKLDDNSLLVSDDFAGVIYRIS